MILKIQKQAFERHTAFILMLKLKISSTQRSDKVKFLAVRRISVDTIQNEISYLTLNNIVNMKGYFYIISLQLFW